MTYYKATRPDATDFFTGTIKYEVGKLVRPAPYKGKPRLCGPGVLHASDAPGEVLLGGSWPCRLFEVEGKPFLSEGHKHGFRQLRVMREVEAWPALGPNGQEVVAFLAEIPNVMSRVPAGEAAWDAARHAASHAAGEAAWDAAWDAARDAVWDAAWHAAWDAARSAAGDAARDAAWDAAWDAAFALVIKDLITPKQFQMLMRPWEILREAAR